MPKKGKERPLREFITLAIKTLNNHLQQRECSTRDYFDGFEAVFELLDQDWVEPIEAPYDTAWRQGYEQCMLDVVEAIADEWGVVIWVGGSDA